MMSPNVLMVLRGFVPEYHRARFGGDWTTNIGETERGWAQFPPPPPAYILPKYPSLNRVKDLKNDRTMV